MKTEITALLGTEYPIIQGAMAHISDGKFAATVSEAGGLGVIASTLHDGQWVKEQVEIARSITDKPFAVNLIMESDIVEECARMCVELKVPICTISAGDPEKIVPILVEGGIKVICLIPHARAAKKMQDLGATAVVAEGMEGGGHIGKMCTFPMVRQVAEAVDIPVIAAGGIADGKALSADEAKAYADLASREELMAQLVYVMASPLSGIAQVCAGPARGLVTALKAVADEKDAA